MFERVWAVRMSARKAHAIVLWDEMERDRVHIAVDAQPLGGDTEIIIRPRSHAVSDRQRGYYRGVVLKILAEHTGYTQDEMHEFLKRKFATESQVEVRGETYNVHVFTTGTEGEAAVTARFITNVIQWAARDLGVVIPEPDRNHRKRARVAA